MQYILVLSKFYPIFKVAAHRSKKKPPVKMAQPNNETDYDKQFQEDIEKATALSMETLALDQFKRNKIHSPADVTSSNIFKSNCK